MKRFRRAWRRLVGTFLGARQDNGLSQELEAHLEMQRRFSGDETALGPGAARSAGRPSRNTAS